MGYMIDNRVAIVAGATSGIGLDLVKDLCAKGWRVACVGRRHEAGKAILKDLPPKKALFFAGDVSNYDEYANIFRKVRQAWGRIDALCQNAAVVDSSSIYILNARQHGIDDIPPAPDMSLVDTNYKGVVYGTQLAIHFMRHNPQPGGRIVVTGSIGSMFPHESYPVYCGTKAAVNHFIRGIAPILKQKENILLNCVMPGIVDTPIVPREMIAAVTPECITPIQTILRGFDTFLEDTTGMAGELLECSADKLIYYQMPQPGNGRITKRAVTVWEPLFRMMHGENSGLPDSLL